MATAHNLTPNSLRAISSGKKNICFVTAVLAKSAELATISRAPESKCLHIQLRPTHPPQSYSHGCSEASESRVTEPLCHSSHLRDGSSLLLLLLCRTMAWEEQSWAQQQKDHYPTLAGGEQQIPCLIREACASQANEESSDQPSQLLLFSLPATYYRCLLIMQINTNAMKQKVLLLNHYQTCISIKDIVSLISIAVPPFVMSAFRYKNRQIQHFAFLAFPY